MALTLLFSDGFDTYNNLALKWTTPGTNTTIDLTGTISRTGLGCCKIISSAFGPLKTLLTNQTNIIVSGAFNPGGVIPSNTGQIFRVQEPINGPLIVLAYRPDLSMAFFVNNGPFLGQTGPGIINVNAYNFISMRIQTGLTGSVRVWLNGNVVIDVPNTNLQPLGNSSFVNTFQLMVFGGTTTGLWDDFTAWSWTDPTADQFPYLPSLYPGVPIADSTPLNWTPSSAGAHFSLVNAVPQQLTTFVQDATPGDIDQYIHAIPSNQLIPPLPSVPFVLAVAHDMYAQLDAAGARSIASNRAGVAGASNFALSTSPLIYQQPYTPGLPNYASLATTPFGPEVTA